MLKINGTYNEAIVYTKELEPSSTGQIEALCNQPFTSGSKIRIMPDVHAGAGCVVGLTMTINDKKAVPNLVGVDIGCGMLAVKLKESRIDFVKLDKVIRANVPSGFSIRNNTHRFAQNTTIDELVCAKHVNLKRASQSIGTLGGGNHFIEVAQDATDAALWLIIHSGSRHLGTEVCGYYQNIAHEKHEELPYKLAYLEDVDFDNYLHDMEITQQFAEINRQAMADVILKEMKLKKEDSFTTIHNYIDISNKILRKGSVSAQEGERLLIPLNMAEGSLLCTGKGNPEWNFSAPHGAGRVLSRSQAKDSITLTQYKEAMKGIFSTCVSKGTIDESPMAYKPAADITSAIGDTVEINVRLKPIYNFKAGAED